ncbi:MAG: DUF1919 domain-containing protein [Clostridia bacterium]|nr:DUF1919 domain-containing protein [Clostridia bacterium]
MNKTFLKIGHRVRKYFRNKIDSARFNNPQVSIITNHCMGGIICHDLGIKFNSPTVNLKILPSDFIKFAENLEEYIGKDIVEVEDKSVSYPVGMLGDVKLWFVHYKTFEQAVNAWNRRKERINWENIRVMLTVREECSDEILARFEKLPYKKVAFANEEHPSFPSVIFANKNGKQLSGYISDIVNVFGKHGYQCGGFDYIKFLNK